MTINVIGPYTYSPFMCRVPVKIGVTVRMRNFIFVMIFVVAILLIYVTPNTYNFNSIRIQTYISVIGNRQNATTQWVDGGNGQDVGNVNEDTQRSDDTMMRGFVSGGDNVIND